MREGWGINPVLPELDLPHGKGHFSLPSTASSDTNKAG